VALRSKVAQVGHWLEADIVIERRNVLFGT
jgi:hypothetical protein